MLGPPPLLGLGTPFVNSAGGELQEEGGTVLSKHYALLKAATAQPGLSRNLGLPHTLHPCRVVNAWCRCRLKPGELR